VSAETEEIQRIVSASVRDMLDAHRLQAAVQIMLMTFLEKANVENER
jgi:hypothetical protein